MVSGVKVPPEPKRAPKMAPKKDTAPSIRDFDEAIPYNKLDQQKALAFLVRCKDTLTQEDLSILRDILPMAAPAGVLELDLKLMMQEQMIAARSLRNAYFTPDGSLRVTSDIKEAREALRSAQQIMDSILKKQGEIDMVSKLMIMEQSILAVAQELPDEQQDKFYKRVERILGEKDE